MSGDNPAKVLFDCIDGFGIVTLNRPQALNALDLDVIRLLAARLKAWESDSAVRAVLFRGAGERAFCAGGDIRALYQHARVGAPELDQFFDEEYALDALIHRYPKPTIALMDGVVMGGGMGIAQGCSLRVVTERTRMAMPETAIGLFPDVGASYFLARLTAPVAAYLGVVGESISGRDALACGLADRLVASTSLRDLPVLLAHVEQDDWPDAIPPSTVPDVLNTDVLAAISRIFSEGSITAIMASLVAEQYPACREWAARTLVQMQQHSPLMMCVTLEQLRRGRGLALDGCQRMERSLMRHSFARGDVLEGIRALLIDKDRQPRWRFRSIGEVGPEAVAAFFGDAPPNSTAAAALAAALP